MEPDLAESLQSERADFSVSFGVGGSGALNLPIPVLEGETHEAIFAGLSELLPQAGFRLWQRRGLLVGAIDEPAAVDLEGQARDL